MTLSFTLLLVFLLGALTGRFTSVFHIILDYNPTSQILYVLLFCIGIGIGANKHIWKVIKEQGLFSIVIPFSTIIGTVIGVCTVSFLIPEQSLRESLAVGSGFGYYSLSSILITKFSGSIIGATALLTNIIRELISIICAPLIRHLFGVEALISAAGATSMDTTLPIIIATSDENSAIPSIVNGFLLSVLSPIFISLLLT